MRKRLKKTGLGFTLITVVVLVAILSFHKNGLASKLNDLKEDKVRKEQRIKELEEEKQSIEEYREYVKSDEYVEDVARNKLGLVYPDDIVFVPEED